MRQIDQCARSRAGSALAHPTPRGLGKARALRLLTGGDHGAGAPWERVQIDSTPCDIRLVREQDRTVIGRPNITFAIGLYGRTILGFSVSLQAASTITVATCLAQACLPEQDWLMSCCQSRPPPDMRPDLVTVTMPTYSMTARPVTEWTNLPKPGLLTPGFSTPLPIEAVSVRIPSLMRVIWQPEPARPPIG